MVSRGIRQEEARNGANSASSLSTKSFPGGREEQTSGAKRGHLATGPICGLNHGEFALAWP